MKDQAITLYDYLSSARFLNNRRVVKGIRHGLVKVDGVVVDDPNTIINPTSKVEFEEKEIPYIFHFVIMLNKPSGYMSSTIDEKYPSLLHLIPPELASRAVLSGRLDHDTEGLLLLSDSGRLANRLVHPSYGLQKEYQVTLDKPLEEKDALDILENGTDFNGELVKPSKLTYNGNIANIVVKEGKYHEVKRIFIRRGYWVCALKRIRFDFLELGDLKVGQWRYLNKEEEEILFNLVGMEPQKHAKELKNK